MSWLDLKMLFARIFLWFKKYWQLIAGISIAIIVFVITRGQRNELMRALEIASERSQRDLQALQESYDKKMAAEHARAEEQRLAAEDLARKISEIEAKYQVDSSTLSKKKKKQLENLMRASSSEVISQGLSDIFGTDLKS